MEELLNEIVARVRQLLNAGWTTVRIVTDHGWLIVSGELPNEDLPHDLATTRWGRCATPKEGAEPGQPNCGVAVLRALCSSLLEQSLNGGHRNGWGRSHPVLADRLSRGSEAEMR